MSKEVIQMQQILMILLENEIVTTGELARAIELSEKTVRNRINRLESHLAEKKLGSIKRKTRVGIWLEFNEVNESAVRGLFGSTSGDVYKSENRVRTIIGLFLKRPDNVLTLNEISETLYLSIPTIANLMSEVVQWFESFGITVERMTNRGHWISFDEPSYRLAYSAYIIEYTNRRDIDQVLEKTFPGVPVYEIRRIILRSEKQWEVKLVDATFVNLLVLTSIMVWRVSNKHPVTVMAQTSVVDYSEYMFVESVVKKTSILSNVVYTTNEMELLAFQILFTSTLRASPTAFDMNLVERDNIQLKRTVDLMIETISHIINIDLSLDSILHQGLMLHLKPAIFRMKHGYQQKNSLYLEIRREYPVLYRAVWSTSIILEDEYGVQVNESELAYVTLYIQGAIERHQQELSVLLVSSKSNAQNQLLVEKLKKSAFADTKIDLISYHMYNSKFEDEYKFILTTEPTESFETNSKIIHIGSILSSSDVRHLNSEMKRIASINLKERSRFDAICHSLFEPDLIVKKRTIDSKEDALDVLCDALESKGYVTQEFRASVKEREKSTQTSIGNSIAIPHGSQEEIFQPRVAMLVLDKPIKWGESEEVAIILLLAIRMKTEQDILITKTFYKQYLNIISSDEKVRNLIRSDNALNIYKCLVS